MDHCLPCGMFSLPFNDCSTDLTAAKEHGFTDIGLPIYIAGLIMNTYLFFILNSH